VNNFGLKMLPMPLSTLTVKSIGHTTTDTTWQYFKLAILSYSILTTCTGEKYFDILSR